MLDIHFIKENSEAVKKGMIKKGSDPMLVDQLLTLESNRVLLLQQVEDLRRQKNDFSREKPDQDIEKGREIKESLKSLEPKLEEAEKAFLEKLNEIPNLPLDDAPEGKGEGDNIEISKSGEIPQFNFTPRDHIEVGKILDIIDFEAASKVAGANFCYLKNEGVLLEIALVNYGMQFLQSKGFIPVITPDLAKEKFYLGTGYAPKGPEAQTYKIENTDLGLIATAEVTLAGYHGDEVLDANKLPLFYGGYSHCFRMEAGAYGKYSKGLYRLHQFTKVEMFAFTKPEQSEQTHQEFLKLEEEFWQSLGIPFRVLEMCTGDLGAQAAKKYDLEAWMPGRGDWGEITSTSNTTDYQARNLNIRYKEGDKNIFVHTLNGTLVATSRGLIAILENFQQEDGTVLVPEVLQKYTGFSKISPK